MSIGLCRGGHWFLRSGGVRPPNGLRNTYSMRRRPQQNRHHRCRYDKGCIELVSVEIATAPRSPANRIPPTCAYVIEHRFNEFEWTGVQAGGNNGELEFPPGIANHPVALWIQSSRVGVLAGLNTGPVRSGAAE